MPGAVETVAAWLCLSVEMGVPRAVYWPIARTWRVRLAFARAWLRLNGWVVAAIVWAIFVVRSCEGCRPSDHFHSHCDSNWTRTYQASVSFDQRCELADDSAEAEALDERIGSELEAVCGHRMYPGFLTPHCVTGNSHWVACDGSVQSLPPEDAERSGLILVGLDQRSYSIRSERDARLELDGEPRQSIRVDIGDSMLQAAAAQRRRRQIGSRTLDAIALQWRLYQQCVEFGVEAVTLGELDTYRGPQPDGIYCDHIEVVAAHRSCWIARRGPGNDEVRRVEPGGVGGVAPAARDRRAM